MNGRRLLALIALAGLIVLPALVAGVGAQGDAWPPLQVQSRSEAAGASLKHEIMLQNVSGIDLADVFVALDLFPGVTFQRFEPAGYATSQFDGKTISFTVIKVPAGQSVGPLAYYIDPAGAAADTLKTKVYASWRGQTPGEIVIPDLSFTGLAPASAPAAASPEPPAESAPPAVAAEPTAAPTSSATEGSAVTAQPAVPAVTVPPPAPAPASPSNRELWDLLARMKSFKWVDLTNTFAPGIPRWPGFPDAQFKTIFDYDKDGFFAQEFVHVGQFGTHMDPPAHFHKGLRTVDQIDLKEMAAPLCVINVADKVAANPDYELTVDDVKAWEARYGQVPEGAFVAMRSDWSKRWPDPVAYSNKDDKGQDHYPGWTVDALKYLFEERKIVGSGHEPPDTDAALAQIKTGFAAETYVLGTDHYQIELLANLDQVPEAGAIAFIVVPKPQGGSGFPARVFAVVP